MNWWLDPEKVKQRKKNYEKNFMKKHGVKNPQQLKEIKEKTNDTLRRRYGCVGFDGKLGEKSKETIRKKYGNKNIMKTEEGKKHFRGDKNPQKDPEIRKRTSETLKKKIKENGHWLKGKTYEEIMGSKRAEERKKELKKSGAYGQSITPKISAPQLELFKMVKEKYPTAVLEYPVLDYCLDIAVPELKVCFEYDGSYWHDIEKDKKRDEVLEEMGWKVIRYVDDLPKFI